MPTLSRLHRPLMAFTAAMAALAVVAAVGLVADPRILTGMPIWAKPLKFAASFVLYAGTLAWMLSLLPRRSRAAERAATVVAALGVVEMIVIVTQVLRGTTSHFNGSTPFDALMWQIMGTAIMVLFAAHFVVGVVLLRARIADRVAAHAVRWGLGLSLLGMLVAVPMTLPSAAPPGQSVIAGAHSVGVPDGGPGLPLLGWSTTGGDLRIGHFVGLHALQILPLLALLLGRRFDALTRVRLLAVGGGAYGMLTILLTWQALRGQPLLRPDALTVAAVAALVAATALAATAVVRARRPELELAA
ncbi:hypothetical protein [Couchioplanes caeruleus]|uniref:Uncharacterized protein n=2 Tax=Couchioplanes caeruleus TaxID=56438 RepID=A0A1K0GM87_9ACTN|nr:hypothetical protein [Couchioplanes caeruleus]OJF13446.1 hypothetical protein BG844_15220 [Couchioplanes caeruleus subsp. caeruleus]ROP32958.1 hypothetical protein EDD30_5916 [Couchioplanes caeruleus]